MKNSKKQPSNKDKQPLTISIPLPRLPRPKIKIRRPKGRVRSGLMAAGFIAVSLLSGYAGARLERAQNDLGLNTTHINGSNKIVTGESQLISKLAKELDPSVVSITVSFTATVQSPDSANFFGFGGGTQQQEQSAAGTGVILSSKGIIMTNRHVVPKETTNVMVTLSDGTQLTDVTVIGRTSDSDSLDVAFLKINDTKGHKLFPAPIGDSSTAEIGDNVVAIGNALGEFQNSVTSGIVSGFGRTVVATDANYTNPENLADLIQTDAAINEGNSGGPLLNLNGQVIGLNTAIAGNAQSIGFAIPINDMKGMINYVLKTGKFARPYLGVHYIPVTPAVANEYNLSVNYGAYVAPTSSGAAPVISGSPADKAGIQEKDIITEVNGVKIDRNHSLIGLLGQTSIGDKLTLTVVRNGGSIQLTATIQAAPGN